MLQNCNEKFKLSKDFYWLTVESLSRQALERLYTVKKYPSFENSNFSWLLCSTCKCETRCQQVQQNILIRWSI